MRELLERLELEASLAQFPEVQALFESDIQRTKLKMLRKFGAIELWKEKWVAPQEMGGGGEMEMEVYTNANGDHVDTRRKDRRPGLIKFIARLQIAPEKSTSDHCVCSIGKSAKDEKWYGWSHRAICGFGIGDRIFNERYGNDKTPFVKHGKRVIKNDADGREAAIKFARSVS